MLTYLIMGVVLLTIGYTVHVLKWNMLIAGYNTRSKEKKEKVDTEGLGKFLGFYGYISGGLFLLLAVLELLGLTIPPNPVAAIFLIWTVIVLYVSQKYDSNTKRGKNFNERKK
ncbi:DUF3784 domain-containing protein [Alkalibacterium sp. 20]|uniref:DUF3784 domain-containing protein n=1 Tax=Alkalibacterium sp. 20 TaxID=1798803 RepID=UPI0009002E95|nr:DUF3784 domain-containing protein [Alkalibacterium sp. 20]OJF97017.1 hypothetical protein AX762_00170 [Alkalibacterium sp. 20]